jgi:general stress protein YciG
MASNNNRGNNRGNNRDNTGSNPKRGFAALAENDPERQREIASLGGKTAHENGTAHEFQEGSREAKEAGRRGGERSRGGGRRRQ